MRWVEPTFSRACAAQLRRALWTFTLLAMALVLSGCGETKPTLVLLVGGAGLSQLGDLGETISATCPDAQVVETGGWDGFRADLKQLVREHPNQALILIGHSFGCETIAAAAGELPPVDLVVMIDPAWDDITLPRTVVSCMWYQRGDAGLERQAVIRNGGRPIIISGDHNEICHSPELIGEVSRAVDDISTRRAIQQRMRREIGR